MNLVRFSGLWTCGPRPQEIFVVHVSVRGLDDGEAVVPPGGLSH